MATGYNPSITTNGLVLHIDAANPKCYNPNLSTNTSAFNYSFNAQVGANTDDVAPTGATVACKHDLTGATTPFMNVRADVTLYPGTYTMSAYIKGTTAFSASFAFVGETNNEVYANTAAITTSWQRFTLTFTLLANSSANRLQIFFGTEGQGKILSVWGVELVRGSTPSRNYIDSVLRGRSIVNLANSQVVGTSTGNINYNSANIGAISYDGSGSANVQYSSFSIPYSTQFNFNTAQTICMIVQPTENDAVRRNPYNQAYGGGGTITQETSGQMNYYWGSSGLNAQAYTSAGSGSGATVAQNETAYMCVVRDSTTVKWYKNGVLATTTSNPFGANTLTGTQSITIGGGYAGQFLGAIPAIQVYTTALTVTEINQNFNAIRGRYGI